MCNIVISSIKGGIGNQLFQYATGYSLAKKYKAIYKQDIRFYDNEKYHDVFKLYEYGCKVVKATEDEISELKLDRSRTNCKTKRLYDKAITKLRLYVGIDFKTHIRDSYGHKPSRAVLRAKTPVYLEGWCGKLCYFDKNYEDIVKLFNLNSIYYENMQTLINCVDEVDSVSIHFRRGDYVGNSYFHDLDIKYYKKAMQHIEECIDEPFYYVFSDDIEWAKRNFKVKNCVFVDDNIRGVESREKDLIDLLLMTKCKHNIIANSSFSWWGAYLNTYRNKIVIYPYKWYEDKKAQKSYIKYPFMPKDWICVK